MPGVTRFDLECHPRLDHDALAVTRRWADDRALGARGRERLVCLTLAAVQHGLRFGPTRLTILLRWLDVDLVRLDVTWNESATPALAGTDPHDVGEAAPIFDGLAREWDVSTTGTGWGQWMILSID
ncbi:hypothetical protein ACFP8W_01845 [Nocardioides hankookensis]|uniref:ATP-binding protein n=1 Tax=Nocardioides hankookensis TaxID=443157 RepID=A0ABW1LH78_9ACTN